MGLYMNDFGEAHKDKAQVLIRDFKAKQVVPSFIDPSSGSIGLFILHHPLWDAVCILDDKRQYDRAIEEVLSGRAPRITWLSIDVKTVERYSSWKLKEKD